MYKKENYWDSHTTMGGKKSLYSEGSVADRGGNYEAMGFENPHIGGKPHKKTPNGYGFGKKKKAKRLGGGYNDNPGHGAMSGGY